MVSFWVILILNYPGWAVINTRFESHETCKARLEEYIPLATEILHLVDVHEKPILSCGEIQVMEEIEVDKNEA